MHEVWLTNASKLDTVSGSQTFRPKGEGSSIPGHSVGDSSDPLGIAMSAEHTISLPKEIDSNPTRKCGKCPRKRKNRVKSNACTYEVLSFEREIIIPSNAVEGSRVATPPKMQARYTNTNK